MIELVIAPQEAGRKLGRLMEHLMPAVPKSFLYKAIRQNKIKIDRKKPADLSVVLQAGNVVQIYLTDEQLQEFGYRAGNVQKQKAETGRGEKKEPLRVLYEDDQLLIVFKPAGIATQKGKNDPWSFTDAALEYLHAKGEGTFGTYRPSFCHRLDKNTAGALIMAKTLEAHHRVDELLSSRKIHKYYLAVTESEAPEWQEETTLVNGYRKDHVKNMAEIVPFQEPLPAGYQPCSLKVMELSSNGKQSLVRVELLTGKSHQIRAQLAFYSHPLVGDGKKKKKKTFRQMLLAYELYFEKAEEPIASLRGKRIRAEAPDEFKKLFPGYFQ